MTQSQEIIERAISDLQREVAALSQLAAGRAETIAGIADELVKEKQANQGLSEMLNERESRIAALESRPTYAAPESQASSHVINLTRNALKVPEGRAIDVYAAEVLARAEAAEAKLAECETVLAATRRTLLADVNDRDRKLAALAAPARGDGERTYGSWTLARLLDIDAAERAHVTWSNGTVFDLAAHIRELQSQLTECQAERREYQATMDALEARADADNAEAIRARGERDTARAQLTALREGFTQLADDYESGRLRGFDMIGKLHALFTPACATDGKPGEGWLTPILDAATKRADSSPWPMSEYAKAEIAKIRERAAVSKTTGLDEHEVLAALERGLCVMSAGYAVRKMIDGRVHWHAVGSGWIADNFPGDIAKCSPHSIVPDPSVAAGEVG